LRARISISNKVTSVIVKDLIACGHGRCATPSAIEVARKFRWLPLHGSV